MKLTFGRNVVILAGTSIGSYALGLLRDRLLAQQFGASRELDIFNSAFLMPDLIMNLFAAALTTAFIPIFAQVLHHQDDNAAYRSANQVLTVIVCIIIGLNSLAWLAMPLLVHLIAPGFSGAELTQLTSASRWMLLSPLLFSISTLLGAVLQGKDRFVAYAMSPLLYNLGIVLGIVTLAPHFGIQGVIFGVLLGAALHLGVRLIGCLQLKYTPGLVRQAWKASAVQRTLKLIGPRVVGLVGVQASLWTFNAMGSTLPAGSVAIFNFARNFQSLPVSFVGITIATVLFPVLAADFAAKQSARFLQNAKHALLVIIGLSVPGMIAMMLLGEWLITFLLGGESFSTSDIHLTALTLSIMSLAIPLESLQHILARLYYAQHNTKRPAIITWIGAMVNVVVCWLATQQFGVVGLAVGFVTMTAIIDSLLFWPLRYQLMKRTTLMITTMIVAIVLGVLLSVGWWQRVSIKDWLTPAADVPTAVSYVEIVEDDHEKIADSAEETEDAETTKPIEIPSELNLAIPFTSQAPLTNWDALHQESCEEASVLMAARFLQGRSIADTNDADNAIVQLVEYNEDTLRQAIDTTAEETAYLVEEFYDLETEVIYDWSWDDVKAALAQGYPVIFPAAGRELGNPNFTAPGPIYHMLVIKGYTAEHVITNDPGTRRGADYTYSYDTLRTANHDWNGGDVNNGAKVILIVKPGL